MSKRKRWRGSRNSRENGRGVAKFTLYIEEQPQEWGLTEDEVVEEIQKTEGLSEGDIRIAVREASGLIERLGWSIASVEHPLFRYGYAIESEMQEEAEDVLQS